MRKVIFFDRDGVINNNELYYVFRWEDFKINNGVIDILQILSKHGYDFIIISNQSGVAKNVYTQWDVEQLHNKLSLFLESKGISILEYYFCIHHPDVTNCLCRKPSSLFFEKAVARFKIDVNQSWMIGDQQRDIEAAEKVGIKGILLPSNTNLTIILNKILQQ